LSVLERIVSVIKTKIEAGKKKIIFQTPFWFVIFPLIIVVLGFIASWLLHIVEGTGL